MTEFKKFIGLYLMALYIGFFSAFVVILTEFYTSYKITLGIITLLLIFSYFLGGYYLGKAAGKRGALIGFTLAIPILVVSYWIPQGFAFTNFHTEVHMVVIPIIAFGIATWAQIMGQAAKKKEKRKPVASKKKTKKKRT